MANEQFTRCPACRTIFRVTPVQLELRAGQVRCGHCRMAFNGIAELIALAPSPTVSPGDDELAGGRATVTLRSATALDPPPEVAVADSRVDANVEPPASMEPDADYENRFAWNRKRPSRALAILIAVAAPLLALALLLQAALHFRDALAAQWPATRPILAKVCAVTGCAIRPMHDVAALSIDASDLQADPAHQGLLVLTATVRNRASFDVGYPYLELTLTDDRDKEVVRRALAPADYLGGTVDVGRGIAGNSELLVKVFIDASATKQAGYRLYLFYP